AEKTEQAHEVLAVPGEPRLHLLETLAVWAHLQRNGTAVFGRSDVDAAAGDERLLWHLRCRHGRHQPERQAVGTEQAVGQGVKGEPPGQRQSSNDLGAGDEVHRGRLTVVSSGKVAVVRGDDGGGGRWCL